MSATTLDDDVNHERKEWGDKGCQHLFALLFGEDGDGKDFVQGAHEEHRIFVVHLEAEAGDGIPSFVDHLLLAVPAKQNG